MSDKKECSFFLKEPGSASPTLIYFHMTCPDGKIKRSTGKKIASGSWSFELQRASGADKVAREINQMIDAIINMIPGVKSECRRNNRVLACSDVNAALDVILQKKQREKGQKVQSNMITHCKQIIEGMKNGSITTPKKKKRYSEATINNYEKVILPKIELYYEKKKKSATWKSVNLEVYNDFISWCHSNNLSNNSIGAYIRHWKVMGKLALDKGWHSNTIFSDKKFMPLKEDTPAIYLDDTKIEKLFKVTGLTKEEETARDWAVLDCYLGLRISDLQKISDTDFQANLFQFVNQKTGAHVAIPIHRLAKKILNKWKGLPPAIPDYRFRPRIRDVAKKAKLKDKFIYVATVGGKVQKFVYEEWECVSPHTFRRSFITNLLKLGFPHAQVMKMAGIKHYDTLLRYFKQTPIEIAKEAADHDFFK